MSLCQFSQSREVAVDFGGSTYGLLVVHCQNPNGLLPSIRESHSAP